MPIKDTPWGSMKQNRAAQHTPSRWGGEPGGIPPKPGFLPPAPPPCHVSPAPTIQSKASEKLQVC